MSDCPTCTHLTETITDLQSRLEQLETALRDGLLMAVKQIERNQKKS